LESTVQGDFNPFIIKKRKIKLLNIFGKHTHTHKRRIQNLFIRVNKHTTFLLPFFGFWKSKK